jgi:hypothetical protein
MDTTTKSPGLRDLTDTQLNTLYTTGDTATQAAVLTEAARRDRRAKQSAADKAWWRRIETEWFDGAHAQYLAAETETNGYLLNRAGVAAGIDPFSLWRGPASRAAKYASEELRNFWDRNRRVTKSEYAWHAARPGRGGRDN